MTYCIKCGKPTNNGIMCEDCIISDSPWLLAMKRKEDDLVEQIEQLKAENAELRARLERAIELPVGLRLGAPIYYLQYFCDYKKCSDTTQQFCCGCPEMIERERKNEKYVICQKPFELKDFQEIGKKYFLDSEGAEARLAELKRGRE